MTLHETHGTRACLPTLHIFTRTLEYLEDANDGGRAARTTEHVYDSDEEERKRSREALYAGADDANVTGTKDDFDKELVPSLSLLFDRVSEGKEPVSGSKLFRLPLELLALVVQNVSEVSLASLALVRTIDSSVGLLNSAVFGWTMVTLF